MRGKKPPTMAQIQNVLANCACKLSVEYQARRHMPNQHVLRRALEVEFTHSSDLELGIDYGDATVSLCRYCNKVLIAGAENATLSTFCNHCLIDFEDRFRVVQYQHEMTMDDDVLVRLYCQEVLDG